MRRDPDACAPPRVEREPLPLVPAGAPRGSGDVAAADRARIADGWQPRFVADRSRAEEAMRLYRELGFEVAADPVAPETLPGGCGGCPLPQGLGFRMIFTRPRSPATGAGVLDEVAVSNQERLMHDPIDRLLEEHRAIMARVDGLRRAVDDLGRRGDAALADEVPVLEAVSAMMRTELVAHARREDEALFPALEAMFGEAGSPTKIMREEHRAIHARADLFRRTLRELNEVEHPAIVAGGERLGALASTGGGPDELRAVGAEILELLDLHFRKEEEILFPMAREVLSPEAMTAVGLRMDEIEADAGGR